MARSIYNVTPESERDAKKKRLAKILSVSERTVREWTSRIDKDAKEARNKRIFDLWMQCYSTDEIAEQTGTPRQTVNDAICPNLEGLPKSDKSAAEHATDFEPPIYNVWKQKESGDRGGGGDRLGAIVSNPCLKWSGLRVRLGGGWCG